MAFIAARADAQSPALAHETARSAPSPIEAPGGTATGFPSLQDLRQLQSQGLSRNYSFQNVYQSEGLALGQGIRYQRDPALAAASRLHVSLAVGHLGCDNFASAIVLLGASLRANIGFYGNSSQEAKMSFYSEIRDALKMRFPGKQGDELRARLEEPFLMMLDASTSLDESVPSSYAFISQLANSVQNQYQSYVASKNLGDRFGCGLDPSQTEVVQKSGAPAKKQSSPGETSAQRALVAKLSHGRSDARREHVTRSENLDDGFSALAEKALMEKNRSEMLALDEAQKKKADEEAAKAKALHSVTVVEQKKEEKKSGEDPQVLAVPKAAELKAQEDAKLAADAKSKAEAEEKAAKLEAEVRALAAKTESEAKAKADADAKELAAAKSKAEETAKQEAALAKAKEKEAAEKKKLAVLEAEKPSAQQQQDAEAAAAKKAEHAKQLAAQQAQIEEQKKQAAQKKPASLLSKVMSASTDDVQEPLRVIDAGIPGRTPRRPFSPVLVDDPSQKSETPKPAASTTSASVAPAKSHAAAKTKSEPEPSGSLAPSASSSSTKELVAKFAAQGVPRAALQEALESWQKYKSAKKVRDDRYVVVMDLTRKSSQKRFWVLDTDTGKIVRSAYVGHGAGDGLGTSNSKEKISYVSNKPGSNASTWGAMLVEGADRDSALENAVRLEGLDPHNRNMGKGQREIKIHSADYFSRPRGTGVDTAPENAGRSSGCPVLYPEDAKWLRAQVPAGSFMYAYKGDIPVVDSVSAAKRAVASFD